MLLGIEIDLFVRGVEICVPVEIDLVLVSVVID